MKIINPIIVITSILMLAACSTQTISPQTTSPQIERTHYNAWEQDVGYTQAVRVGDTLYLSGMVSEGETLAAQLEGIYKDVQKTLSDYGVSTDQIIKEVIFTTDMDALAQAVPLRKQYYKEGIYPSATWVQVDRLLAAGAVIEIEFIVLVPSKK